MLMVCGAGLGNGQHKQLQLCVTFLVVGWTVDCGQG